MLSLVSISNANSNKPAQLVVDRVGGGQGLGLPRGCLEEPFWVATNDDLSLWKVVGCTSNNKMIANGLSLGKVITGVSGGKEVDDSSPRKDTCGTDNDKPVEERYKPLATVIMFRNDFNAQWFCLRWLQTDTFSS